MKVFTRFIRDDAGQDLFEYALLLAIIAVVVTVTLTSIGTKVKAKFDAINGAL